jgi:hypothetical protein
MMWISKLGFMGLMSLVFITQLVLSIGTALAQGTPDQECISLCNTQLRPCAQCSEVLSDCDRCISGCTLTFTGDEASCSESTCDQVAGGNGDMCRVTDPGEPPPSPPTPATQDCGFPGADEVVIYQNTNRGNPCQLLPVDNYLTASSFKLPDDSISAIDVGSDVRAVLYRDPDFRGAQAHFEGGYYYDPIGKINDNTSSIEIFQRLGGPAAAYYEGNYPSNSQNFWSEDAQGLANDGANWFVVRSPDANDSFIFKVPLSYDLNSKSSKGLLYAGMPQDLRKLGYDHLGDPDQRYGFLFVPIEGPGKNPRIGVWSTEDLRFLSSFELLDNMDTNMPGTNDQHVPWLAIRHSDDTLWVSHSDGVDHVKVYDILWDRLTGMYPPRLVLDNPRLVTLMDRDNMAITLKSMQGGVFNSTSTLLYTSNGACDSNGYIRVFAIDDQKGVATLQAQSENAYFPFNFETHPHVIRLPFIGTTVCAGDEAEGLDWLDVRGLNVPGIPDGQLHLVMVNNHISSPDAVYLKHYSE